MNECERECEWVGECECVWEGVLKGVDKGE